MNSTAAVQQPTVVTAQSLSALPREALGHVEGVHHRVVWRDGRSMAGVMTVEPGARLGSHAHRRHHHHMLVLDGEALILGRRMEPGSYAHVPAGVEHDIDASDTGGCTVFYLYIAHQSDEP